MRCCWDEALAVAPWVTELRRELHRQPELSGKEVNTLVRIARELQELDISFEQYPGTKGITATIGSGDRCIALRADVDALPVEENTGLPFASQNAGVMHACGHDVHTAIALGAARVLKAREQELGGRIKLFFQPAEETTGGAVGMIEHGAMEGVDAILALHVDPTIPVGTVSLLPGKMNAKVIDLHIRVVGQSCHGAHPEQGTDAIVAAAHIITALQTVASRQTAPTKPVVVTIGTIRGGTKANIVAGEVTLSGTVRVLEDALGETVKAQITGIAQSVAAAWGASAEVRLHDDNPALANDRSLTYAMGGLATELLGKEHVIYAEEPSLGADDFAFFSQLAPGCYFNIGTKAPGQTGQALHASTFAPDEGCIPLGIALLVGGAKEFLEGRLC